MMRVWLVVALSGAGTMLLKAAGPALLGRRRLPERVASILGLLGPALLSALVVTQVFGGATGLVLDHRSIGIAAAALALFLRLPVAVAVVAAAAATALGRIVL